jgi:uncharacterized protein
MKLNLATNDSGNIVTAYGPGFVAVNGVRHATSVVVLPERLIAPWPCVTFADLDAAVFDGLARLGADILLLGTGRTHRFPHPSITRPLLDRRIGLEVMTTDAACRTYGFLVAEGRNVAAALIVESGPSTG